MQFLGSGKFKAFVYGFPYKDKYVEVKYDIDSYELFAFHLS